MAAEKVRNLPASSSPEMNALLGIYDLIEDRVVPALERLVELEEERRTAERPFEAVAAEVEKSLQPGNAEPEDPDYALLAAWFRDSKGEYRAHTLGGDRLLTPEEIEYVTRSPRREARERRSR